VLGVAPYLYLLVRTQREDRMSTTLERFSAELRISSGRKDSKTYRGPQTPLLVS
jgi:hypothetical protein